MKLRLFPGVRQLVLSGLLLPLAVLAEPLTLQQAESLALANDPVVQALESQADAFRQQAVAADTLPDPKLKLGLMNFPTDTYRRDQEPMTQIQLGLQQMFPRGDSLAIKSRRNGYMAEGQSARAINQKRMVRQQVRYAWLEVFYWQQAASIIEKNHDLFERLVKITQSQYATGRHKQQDVVHAQLELDLLEDRLTNIHSRFEQSRVELGKWLGEVATQSLPKTLPELPAIADKTVLQSDLETHPMLQMEQAMLDASEQGVAMARQSYKPEWMLDVTYGFRDGNNPNGSERADFLSAMVMFDLPLFTGSRQDKQLAASQARRHAAMLNKQDRQRELQRQLDNAHVSWTRLGERIEHYERELLNKARENAEASLHAYQSRRGDFTTLMRAQIRELETQLKALRLRVDRAKAQAKLLYLAGESS